MKIKRFLLFMKNATTVSVALVRLILLQTASHDKSTAYLCFMLYKTTDTFMFTWFLT